MGFPSSEDKFSQPSERFDGFYMAGVWDKLRDVGRFQMVDGVVKFCMFFFNIGGFFG